MKKNYGKIVLVFVLLLLFVGCTNVPKSVDLKSAKDFEGTINMNMKTPDFGERIIDFPVHVFYDEKEENYQIKSISETTLNAPDGRKIVFNLEVVGEPNKSKILSGKLNWSAVLVTGNEGKNYGNGSIPVKMKIVSINNEEIIAEYSINSDQFDKKVTLKINK